MRRPNPQHKLAAHCERDPKTGCLNYMGATDDHGYGQFRLHCRNTKAHRAAYILAHGGIPPGLQVLHTCDNTRCCEPSHLFLGTHADNMADKKRKGRCRNQFSDLRRQQKEKAMQIWILEAEHKTVPGRRQEAHYTRESARASARDLRRAHRGELEYCEIRPLTMSPRPSDIE